MLRGFLTTGPAPIADLLNLLALGIILIFLHYRPRWYRILSWLTFFAFIFNIFLDGLGDPSRTAVQNTHVLIPLLVLYGTLLGDRWLSITATVLVLGVYGGTIFLYAPLPRQEFFYITNLAILTLVLGLSSWMVWIMHRLLLKSVEKQSRNLEEELGLNQKLLSVIYHDIGNKVTALMGSLALIKSSGGEVHEEIERIDKVVGHIKESIHGLRVLRKKSQDKGDLQSVRGEEITILLQDSFRAELEKKRQSLVLLEGSGENLIARTDLLINLVLFVLMRNAIKFSPRGATLMLRVKAENQGWRISLSDEGSGMDPAIIRSLEHDQALKPTEGTDGEKGLGLGLKTARFYTSRLGGHINFKQAPGGGTEAGVWVPYPGLSVDGDA